MEIDEYAADVCTRVMAADDREDWGESIRLLTVLRVALREQIALRAKRLEKQQES